MEAKQTESTQSQEQAFPGPLLMFAPQLAVPVVSDEERAHWDEAAVVKTELRQAGLGEVLVTEVWAPREPKEAGEGHGAPRRPGTKLDATIPTYVDLVHEVTQGWGVASDLGVTVALDLELTEELRAEGRARELIRVVQDARKAAGLDVSDRIVLGVAAEGVVAEALSAHRAMIAAETLAVEMLDGVEDAAFRREAEVDATVVAVGISRA